MKSIYNFGIYCYKQLVALAGIRNVKARKLTQGQKGIFDYLSRHADPQGGYLWIHASSLGEFEQGRPLIEAIKKRNPIPKYYSRFSLHRVTKSAKIIQERILFATFRSTCRAM